MNGELKIVGQSVPRLDAHDKVTGAAKYAGDMWQYGMLYGKVLRSPYAHAKIVRIDTNKAEQLEGVKAVLTPKDTPSVLLGETGTEDANILPDRARFVGDELVAVAAETEEIAERALELIDIGYEVLPAVFNPDEALKPEAPLIPPPECSNSNLLISRLRTTSREWGNVEKGFEQADYLFEDVYYTRFIQHMPIEPRACLARWDNEKLIIWVSTQKPFDYRRQIARALSMPETRVKLIVPYVGGGFGSKQMGRYGIIAALLAKKTNRPVRIRFTKEEDMLSRIRPATVTELKMGVKKDGTPTALHGSLSTYGGGYNWTITTTATPSLRNILRCRNVKFEARSVYTNHPYTGQLRGVMNTVMNFAVNQLADRVAEQMRYESLLEFVRKTHIQAGDECSANWEKEGVLLSSCGLDECLERGSEAIGWEALWKGWKTPVKVDGSKKTGIGMSAVIHDSGYDFFVSSALVLLNMDGTVGFFTPVTELGQGAITTQAQVLSEALGIPLDDIHVVNADTEVTPLDPAGQIASTTAHVASLATKRAGEDVRQQLLERASRELAVTPEVLDIENGIIYVKSEPDRKITVRALMAKTAFGIEPIIGKGTVRCPGWPQKAYNFGAHFAIVEVDTETGEVKVVKYVAAHDVGRALNPLVVEGQIQGGVAMGLSFSLSEELVFDVDGKPLNLSTTDYKIFTSGDCPEIVPVIVETDDPLGAYGAKGFAEAPTIGVPGCIANAIYNAIGIRFKELPMTPEKVLEAIKEREKE